LNIGNRSDTLGVVVPIEDLKEDESPSSDQTPDLNPVLSNSLSVIPIIPEKKSKSEETKKESFTSYCILYDE